MSPQGSTPPRATGGPTKSHKSLKPKRRQSSKPKRSEYSPPVTTTSASGVNVNSTASSWNFAAVTSYGNNSITTAAYLQLDASDDVQDSESMLDYQSNMAYDLTSIGSWISADHLVDSTSPYSQVIIENNVPMGHSLEQENAQTGYWTTGPPSEVEGRAGAVAETQGGKKR